MVTNLLIMSILLSVTGVHCILKNLMETQIKPEGRGEGVCGDHITIGSTCTLLNKVKVTAVANVLSNNFYVAS